MRKRVAQARSRSVLLLPGLLALASCLQATREQTVEDLGDGGAADSGSQTGPCLSLEPKEVDFGSAAIGTTVSKPVTITNICDTEQPLVIPAVRGASAVLFATVPVGPSAVTLKAHEVSIVQVQYSPQVISGAQSTAYLAFDLTGNCAHCVTAVGLRGMPVDRCSILDRDGLNFRATDPDSSVVMSVTLSNVCGTAAVHLPSDPVVLNIAGMGVTSVSGAYQLGPGFPTKDTVVLPGESIQVPVIFTPLFAGTFRGELDISTDDASGAGFGVSLAGLCGAASTDPVILCAPYELNFGDVPVGGTSTSWVECSNFGETVPGTPASGLVLQLFIAFGPGNSYQVAFDQPFPAAGLAPGEGAKINVTFAPTTGGISDLGALLISSNDPTTPEYLILLNGTSP